MASFIAHLTAFGIMMILNYKCHSFSREFQSSHFLLQGGWKAVVPAEGVLLSETNLHSLTSCLFLCLEDKWCTSVNYKQTSVLCLLYNVSVSQDWITPDSHWMFAQRLNFQKGLVRLVDGDSAYYGRAEAYVGGRWGAIIDQTFGKGRWPTAVCKELGFTEAANVKRINDTLLPPGGGHVAISAPVCKGILLDGFSMEECYNPDPPDYTIQDEAAVECTDDCIVHLDWDVACP